MEADDDDVLPAWDELDKIPDFPVMDQDAHSADIQSLLVAVANVTKLLAGQLNNGKFTRLSQRTALRTALGVPDNSPLLRPQLVRNSWEHIDDRLETWWDESSTHNYVELIGPSAEAEQLPEKDRFGRWDPDQDCIFFWDQKLDLAEVMPVLAAIEKRAETHLSKPLWT